jgi:actin-related protein
MVELGDMSTQVVPIYEGYSIPAAFNKVNLGGRDLTKYFLELLNSRGYATDFPF